MLPEVPRLPEKFDWWDVRSTLEDWFFRVFRSQSAVQPGTIAVYGIATAPEGWVLCDNAEYQQSKYPELFAVIRQTFGGGVGTFRVPSSSDLPTLTGASMRWIIKV